MTYNTALKIILTFGQVYISYPYLRVIRTSKLGVHPILSIFYLDTVAVTCLPRQFDMKYITNTKYTQLNNIFNTRKLLSPS